LAANLAQHRVPGRTHAVFGMLLDKPIADVARAVADQVDAWYAVTLVGARGAAAEHIGRALAQAGVRGPVTPFATAAAGFEAARAAAKPTDRILVFGSFYTVGDILAHLGLGPA
jgi:dihydrofolate synthase/folylpolyglutamate synthase